MNLQTIYFIILVVINYFGSKWMEYPILQQVGLSKKEVKERSLKEVNQSANTQKAFYRWLLQNSANPQKAKMWIFLHSLSLAPSLICVFFSFATNQSKVLQYAIIIVPIYVLAISLTGFFYKKHEKNRDNKK